MVSVGMLTAIFGFVWLMIKFGAGLAVVGFLMESPVLLIIIIMFFFLYLMRFGSKRI